MTRIKVIDQQIINDVITAFNSFDTGFKVQKENCRIKLPILPGRIHKTYILEVIKNIELNDIPKKYIVQNLSRENFDLKSVEYMIKLFEIAQENAEVKGAFSKGGILEDWTKIKYFNVVEVKKKPSSIHVEKKILYYNDVDNNPLEAWRLMEYVEGTIYEKFVDIGKDLKDNRKKRFFQLKAAKLLGEAIAKFIILIKFLPENTRFTATLPGFHDTQGYIHEMNNLLAGKKVHVKPGKGIQIAKIIDGLLDGSYKNGKYTIRVKRMIEIFQNSSSLSKTFKFLPTNLKKVIAHGDLKIGNVIWKTDKIGCPTYVKCFVDLDTIGVYAAMDDFGDAARSIINIHGESIWKAGKKINDVKLDKEILEQLIIGYLNMIKKSFNMSSLDEIKIYLYRAVAVYFFQLGTRFLKAFMSELYKPTNRDRQRHFVYFSKHSDSDIEDINLRLAEIQYMALVRFLTEFKEKMKLDELNIRSEELKVPFGW